MIVISNFYKLILIIILIIILFELVKNVNTETFQVDSTPKCEKEDPQTCPFDYIIKKVEDQDKHLEDIGKNLIELEWTNTNNNLIFNKFIIVIFINNRGPFFDAVDNANIYKCPIPLKKGVKYKFGVIGIYTEGVDVNSEELITGISIKEITVDALNNNYNQTKLNNWIQNVSCKSNGRHTIISKEKCDQQTSDDNSIIAKHSDSTDDWFSEEKHIDLMKALTNKSPSKLNVNLSHNLPN
jgi:hypothetical protein